MTMKVYLSGRIAGLSFEEANAWRSDVTEKLRGLGVQAINPLRGRMFFNGDDSHENHNELVQRDLHDIRMADIVLVYLPTSDRLSVGTAMETWHAYYCEHKPVVLVSDDPRYLNHPWMQVACTKMFSTLDKTIEYIAMRWGEEGV